MRHKYRVQIVTIGGEADWGGSEIDKQDQEVQTSIYKINVMGM